MRVSTLSLQLMLQVINKKIFRMKIAKPDFYKGIVITMQYFFLLSRTMVGSPNSQVKYSKTETNLQGLMNLFHFLDTLASAMAISCSMLAMIANSLMYLVTKSPIRLIYHGRQVTRSILLLKPSHFTHGSDIIDQKRSTKTSFKKKSPLQRSNKDTKKNSKLLK